MTEPSLYAFPPILGPNPHTLILGTMPGARSLLAGQYYGHPQNQFWRFMGDIFGAGLDKPYDERLEILKAAGIAVWDVFAACDREGSMDADIKNGVINDFDTFLEEHRSINRIVFDSATAERAYFKLALPGVKRKVLYTRVPSPSPAYAAIRYEVKLEMWRAVFKTGHSCLNC